MFRQFVTIIVDFLPVWQGGDKIKQFFWCVLLCFIFQSKSVHQGLTSGRGTFESRVFNEN